MIRDEELPRFLRCFIDELSGPIRADVQSPYSAKVVDAIVMVLRRLEAQQLNPPVTDWRPLGDELAAIIGTPPTRGGTDAEADIQASLADKGNLERLVAKLRAGDREAGSWLSEVSTATLAVLERHEVAIRPDGEVRTGAKSVADDLDDLRLRLDRLLKARYPELPDHPVRDMTVAPGGQIKRTILFGLDGGSVLPSRLVLRQDMPFNLTGTVVTDEYVIMDRVFRLGLPVPEPIFCEDDETILGGRFMIMREIGDAETAGTYFAEERAHLGSTMGPHFGDDVAALLARLHGGTIDDDAAVAEPAGSQMVEAFRDQWRALRKPAHSAVVDAGIAWLLANPLPASRPRCLVHGDIGSHNMMTRDGRLVALLDWELAHVTDPAEDIAQCKTLLLPDVMPWDDFKTAYIAAGGPAAACDDHAIAYYSIWIYLKHLGMNAQLWSWFMDGERSDAPAASVAAHYFDRLLLYAARALKEACALVK